MAAAKSHQVELLQQWQQQQQASQVYLQVLQQVLDSLMELIQDHMLGQQKVPTIHLFHFALLVSAPQHRSQQRMTKPVSYMTNANTQGI